MNIWNLLRLIVAALLTLVLFMCCNMSKLADLSLANPVAGASIASPLALSGTGPAGKALRAFIGDKEIAIPAGTTIGADGKFNLSGLDLNALGLSGEQELTLQALDGSTVVKEQKIKLILPEASSGVAFTYPKEGEILDAQDYLLEGTGPAGAKLDVLEGEDGTKRIDGVVVDPSGNWNYGPVPVANTKPGTYHYWIRPEGGAAGTGQHVRVEVAAGQTEASNAKCPCRLRVFSFTNGKVPTPNAVVTLFKDGQEVGKGASGQVFRGLAEGAYTYTVEATGYAPFTAGKASVPKNKAFAVYVKPAK